ncbi:MAG: magnesium transporter [Planctomycetota bacterium]|nr:MAG: magnesium transporter [Planctomycetota bacterium]
MNSLVRLVLPDVQDLLREGGPEDIAAALAPFHSADIAELIGELTDDEASRLLLGLAPQQQVEAFEQLPLPQQLRLVNAVGPEHMLHIIEAMSSDDRADLVGALPGELAARFLERLPAEEAKDVAHLANYPEETAGGIMTSEFVRLSPNMTVAEATERVREQASSMEQVYALYVLDDEGHLQGVVSLAKLVLSPATKTVGEVMYPNPISCSVDDDQETVMRKLRHYDFIAIPVLDAEGRMVGIVTHDDALDVAIEEADEDAQRMGALEPLQEAYFATNLVTLVRKRATWLILLLMAGLVAGSILRGFQATLQRTVALIFFLPLIAASGGNSGSQSATLVIRALAVGDMTPSDWLKVVRRELASGLALGVLLGFFGVGVAMVLVDDWQHVAPTVWLTLVCVVTAGSLLGSLMPLALARIGVDPAITSTPLVAGMVDILGILTYVLIAGLILEAS